MDTSTLLKDATGNIRTGQYSSVNPTNINDEGLAMARNFSGQVQPTINSDNLNVSPVSVPPQTPSTLATGITGAAQASGEAANTFMQGLQKEQQQAQQTADSGQTSVQNKLDELVGIQKSQTQVEEKLGIPQKTQEYNTAYNSLQASQRAQTNELRGLEQNTQMNDAQRAAATRDINRKFAFEQADLSIVLDVANRNLSSAQAQADRKIALALEPVKTQLEYMTKFYEMNREDLSKKEQNLFQAKIAEQERAYNTQRDELKRLEDAKLDALNSATANGAPMNILQKIQGAKTAEEAAIAAGSYGYDPLKKAQVANYYSEMAKRNKEIIDADNLKNFVTPPLVNLATGKIDPSSQLASVIASTGAKTGDKLKLTGAVVANIQALAEAHPDGNFPGTGWVRAGALTVSPEGQTTRTSLSGLEGTVESWMTGAAVSDDQAERIKRDLIPRQSDTDKQIRQKLNALTDYMMNYAKGDLVTQGINFQPTKVDFFNNNGLRAVSNDDLLSSVSNLSSGIPNNQDFFNQY